MSINFNLKAELRTKSGSAESRRIRKAGNIPAVIYNSNNNIQVSVPSREFEKEYLKGNIFTTIINLELDGKSQKVIANKIDLNAITDRPAHISFVPAGNKVKAKVKVTFTGKEKSPGLKKGGFLHITDRKVELICDIDAVPQEVVYDIGKMKVGDKVRSSNLELPKGAAFANKKEFNIASILGRGTKEETAENTEGAVPAEGAEAAAEGENKDA